MSYNSTLGAALVGLTLTSILYGITLLQCFLYLARYTKDPSGLKALVLVVWVVDTAHTIIVTHILYYYLIINYKNPDSLEFAVWSLGVEVGLTTLAALIAQSFFGWRVWILSYHNKMVPGGIVVTMAIAFFTGVACMIEIWRLKEIPRLIEIEWLVGVKHGTVAAADIGIAIAQCWYLHFARTGVKKTDPLINALMIYSINRGVLTSIAAVADLACFLAMPDNFVWLTFNFVVSKLHTNSLLATLNTRDAMRGRGEDTDLIETVTTIRIPTNPIETIGLQEDRFPQPKTRPGPGSVSTSVERLSSEHYPDVQVVNRISSEKG